MLVVVVAVMGCVVSVAPTAARAQSKKPVPVDVMIIADSTGAFPYLHALEDGVRARRTRRTRKAR